MAKLKAIRLEAMHHGKVKAISNHKGDNCINEAKNQKAVYQSKGWFVRHKLLF